MIVAIDGPAGAGKGTVARAVAGDLGFTYVDTGAMYRAMALACLRRGTDPDDEVAATEVARSAKVFFDGDRVFLDGEDVTGRIREPDVTSVVSSVAAHSGVRSAVGLLQEAALTGADDVVMEGRDIGTVVAPKADLKVFLTASPRERARRRALQLGLPLDGTVLTRVQAEIDRRDRADASRSASPFQRADDAVVVDSTDKTIDEVVTQVASMVREARDRE